MGVSIRNALFDWGMRKSKEFDIPIVCVGNLTVGGTGKTPHTEFLIEILSQHYNVAVISRGYKRKTKGFVLATPNSSFKAIGDEPKQIKLKFPDIPVAVCEKRADGIEQLRKIHPEVNLIILDDAMQHRQVESWVNILLMDYNRPIYDDHMLPWGELRDSVKQKVRANIVIATKCPETMRPLDCRLVKNKLELYTYQTLYFSRFQSETPRPLFPHLKPQPLKTGQPVIAMAGIAKSGAFVDRLQQHYNVVDQLIFRDHYTYKMRDIDHLSELLKKLPKETAIVMTEKDAVKLLNSKKIHDSIKRKFYYVPISVKIANECHDEFVNQLLQYVQKNHKHSITHPQ